MCEENIVKMGSFVSYQLVLNELFSLLEKEIEDLT